MTALVYLLEDDADIAKVITRTLAERGLSVKTFRRIADFQREIERQTPDLCLIDLSLPDGDALPLVSGGALPESVPKLIVTGRGALADRVVGLEIGADDYIVKPFEPRELLARVRAVLRRSEIVQKAAAASPKKLAAFGDWVADFDGCTLTDRNGETTDISSAESKLLLAFVSNAGRVLNRARLLDETSGRADEPFDRSIDARISRLRRKLKDDPRNPQIIRTVYGAGYVFSLRVEWKEAAS